MCDHVCVCVIFGRIGLCGTVLLRHDVEVRDRQSLFPFSLSFFRLSLRTLAESTSPDTEYVWVGPVSGCLASFDPPLAPHVWSFDPLLLHYSPKVVGSREGSFGTRDVVCADDLGCMLCCGYDLEWNLKTYLRNALNTGQVCLLTTAPIH